MKLKSILLLVTLALPSFTYSQNLLNAPQKIVIDRKPGRVGFLRNRLLVSNYNNGAIVEIDTLGNQQYFLAGANFIDGMEIVGNVVYGVGTNRTVRGYNLDTKLQVMNIQLSGGGTADYLSSVTYDSTGHLLVSCPNQHAIYRIRISDGKYWIFAQNNGLNRPNGILLEYEKDRIVVIDDSQGTSLIHAISLSDSTVTTLVSTTFNSPDGIVRDKYGYYYVGGYYLTSIYRYDPGFSGGPRGIFTGQSMVYPTYDADDHSLLITYYDSNGWERIPLSSTASVANTTSGIKHSIYPNPSAGDTHISLELCESSPCEISILNLQGQIISKVFSGDLTSGKHEFFWERDLSMGKLKGGGVLLCVINLKNRIISERMIVL